MGVTLNLKVHIDDGAGLGEHFDATWSTVETDNPLEATQHLWTDLESAGEMFYGFRLVSARNLGILVRKSYIRSIRVRDPEGREEGREQSTGSAPTPVQGVPPVRNKTDTAEGTESAVGEAPARPPLSPPDGLG